MNFNLGNQSYSDSELHKGHSMLDGIFGLIAVDVVCHCCSANDLLLEVCLHGVAIVTVECELYIA